MDLWEQLSGQGARGTGHYGVIGGADVERVQVREYSLGYCQRHGEQPDESCPQDDARGSAGPLDIEGLHNGSVPDAVHRRRDHMETERQGSK